MKKIYFKDFAELGDKMYKEALDGKCVAAVLFYEDTFSLIADLMQREDVIARLIDAAEPVINGYSKEYIVVLDEDLDLFVEPTWRDGKYLPIDAHEVFVDGNASYSSIRDVAECLCWETYIGEDVDDNDKVECGKPQSIPIDYFMNDDLIDIIRANTDIEIDKQGNACDIVIDVDKIFEILTKRNS